MDTGTVNAIRSVYGLDNPGPWLENQLSSGKTFALLDEKRANTFLYPYGYLASRKEDIRSLNDSVSENGPEVKTKISLKTDHQGRELTAALETAAREAESLQNRQENGTMQEARNSVKGRYWRPNPTQREWSLLNRRMEQEINDPAHTLDDATQWAYANEKGS